MGIKGYKGVSRGIKRYQKVSRGIRNYQEYQGYQGHKEYQWYQRYTIYVVTWVGLGRDLFGTQQSGHGPDMFRTCQGLVRDLLRIYKGHVETFLGHVSDILGTSQTHYGQVSAHTRWSTTHSDTYENRQFVLTLCPKKLETVVLPQNLVLNFRCSDFHHRCGRNTRVKILKQILKI